MAGYMNFLRDVAQGASNSAASTVSGPVDMAAWLLRKAGLGDVIGDAPVGGSAWMERRGLTAKPQNALAAGIGDFAAMAAPIGVAAKSPQIANALIRAGENLSAPATLSRGAAGAQRGAVAFPQEEALLIAQRNAAKPVSEGGLGLPPNNTPMDRARAMGFGDEVLHGTVNDFEAFAPSTRMSVYATKDPAIADIYATATGRHRGLREVNAAPNVMPLMARGKQIEYSDFRDGSGGWGTENLADALGTERTRNLIKRLPEFGYDSAKVQMDDLGGRQIQYIYPDPSVLRSRFAAFDPAKRSSNNLLAGVGAGSVGIAALLDQLAGEQR